MKTIPLHNYNENRLKNRTMLDEKEKLQMKRLIYTNNAAPYWIKFSAYFSTRSRSRNYSNLYDKNIVFPPYNIQLSCIENIVSLFQTVSSICALPRYYHANRAARYCSVALFPMSNGCELSPQRSIHSRLTNYPGKKQGTALGNVWIR